MVLFHDLQKKESVFAGGIVVARSEGLSVPTADLFQLIFIITGRIAGATVRVSNFSLECTV